MEVLKYLIKKVFIKRVKVTPRDSASVAGAGGLPAITPPTLPSSLPSTATHSPSTFTPPHPINCTPHPLTAHLTLQLLRRLRLPRCTLIFPPPGCCLLSPGLPHLPALHPHSPILTPPHLSPASHTPSLRQPSLAPWERTHLPDFVFAAVFPAAAVLRSMLFAVRLY